MMNSVWRRSEMTSEGTPIPSPSSAPQAMTETEEITKPRLIVRKAALPAAIVSAFCENSPINSAGTNQHSAVPTAMMQAESASATR